MSDPVPISRKVLEFWASQEEAPAIRAGEYAVNLGDLAAYALALVESLQFCLDIMPEWTQDAPMGLCPTMYGTGSQAGDRVVIDRLARARALIGEE